MQWSNLTTLSGNYIMKLIKFIAATALIASTSLLSGHSTVTGHTATQYLAACPDWPYCRDVDFTDPENELKVVGVCPDWPYCRDVDYTEQNVPAKLNSIYVALVNKTV